MKDFEDNDNQMGNMRDFLNKKLNPTPEKPIENNIPPGKEDKEPEENNTNQSKTEKKEEKKSEIVKVTFEQMQNFSENLKKEDGQKSLSVFLKEKYNMAGKLDLSGLNLEGMYLKGARITAKCWFVNFGGANLKKANFFGNQMLFCNLAGSNVKDATLNMAKVNGSICLNEDLIKEEKEIYKGNLKLLADTKEEKYPQEYFSDKEKFLETIAGKKDLAAPFNYRQALLYFAEHENNPEQREKYVNEANAIVKHYGERALFSPAELEERENQRSESLHNTEKGIVTTLLCLKSTNVRMPTPLKRTIAGMALDPILPLNEVNSERLDGLRDRWQKRIENEKKDQENQKGNERN